MIDGEIEIPVAEDSASGLDLEVVSADRSMKPYEYRPTGKAGLWDVWLREHGDRLSEMMDRGLPSDEIPDKIDSSSLTPSKGGPMGNWLEEKVTDKQQNYLNALMAETVKLQTQLKDNGVDGADELLIQTEKVLVAASARIDAGTFTKGNASQAIDFIVDMNRKLKARLATYASLSVAVAAGTTVPRPGSKPPSAAVNEDGMYQTKDGTIWKVQVAKQGSGRLYAKRLVITEPAKYDPHGGIVKPAKGKFEFARGAIHRLTPSDKMAEADAKKFGKLYGMCCVCAAELTAEESIADGIGPVCGKRFKSTAPTVEVPSLSTDPSTLF